MIQYRGRFAPSPSGDLHFGSLVAALGSYLDAKSNNGQWLVRMEDIDPPREVPGASDAILRTLEAFELCWDGEVTYQSQRHDFYQCHLDKLINQGFCYGCDCTRKMIMGSGGLYQGNCQHKGVNELTNPHSLRFRNDMGIVSFKDKLLGCIHVSDEFANEDFILKRKDGLYAYQLVVVLDDIEQGITDVVRGSDLLEVTTRQMTLFNHIQTQHVKTAPIEYLHLPLAITDNGLKLSKQNRATALNLNERKALLLNALIFLGQLVEDDYRDLSLSELLVLATKQWNINAIPKQAQVVNY